VRVTGGHDTRVSLAALIATRPGCRPRLIYRTHRARRGDQRKGFTEADYARILDAAHQQLGGPLVVVWDGLNTHVSRAMRELVAARSWLRVYRLPPYASELNPVEPVWSNLKRSLANLTKHDIGQLTALIRTRLRRMQHRPGLLEDSSPRPALTSVTGSSANGDPSLPRVIPVGVTGGSLKQRGGKTPAAAGVLGESVLQTPQPVVDGAEDR
jgi:hypothetical protein